MNSVICRTSGLAANMLSTSSSRSRPGALARKQHAIGLAELMDLIAGKAVALEPDDVEPRQIGAVAEHHAKGNDVLLHPRHATHETIGTDTHKLMHGAKSAEDRVVADGHVTRQGGVVDKNDMVSDLAIMGDVHSHHQQAVTADACHKTTAFGAWVHGDVLTNDRVRSDLEAAVLAVIFLVLRNVADGGKEGNPSQAFPIIVRPATAT